MRGRRGSSSLSVQRRIKKNRKKAFPILFWTQDSRGKKRRPETLTHPDSRKAKITTQQKNCFFRGRGQEIEGRESTSQGGIAQK